MTSRQLRLLRASAASFIATILAAVSHTFAGGAAPHPLLILAVSVFLIPLASLLIGVRASRSRVALTVLVSQALFHITFQVLGAPTGSSVVSVHHHHGFVPLGDVSIAALPDLAMIAGHVLAAIATTALMWRGESLIRTIAGWMLARIPRLGSPIPAQHRPPAVLASRQHPLFDAVLNTAVSRRGPPRHS